MITFTKHAIEKFSVLTRHGFSVTEQQVLDVLHDPERIDYSRLPLFIAQRSIDDTHVLRVVYKKKQEEIRVITFYPGRKKQYERD